MPGSEERRDAPRQVGFLLLPGFSLLAQACAMEPLHVANLLAERRLYVPRTFGLDGRAVKSAAELVLTPESVAGNDAQPLDMLVVCGVSPSPASECPELHDWLQRLASRGVMLGGIAGGTQVLARAGVLEGYRVTLHVAGAEAFMRDFPGVHVSHQLFEIDRDRLTCGGGTASMDMMMTLIAQQHGNRLAERVSEHFVCERIRMADEPQHVPLRARLAHAPQSLVDAVTLMEANIEEPLTTHELAEHLGISRRQLERLFKKYLQAVPSRYYLELRLQKARQLLRDSEQAVGDIALSTGFSSGAHFSTAYRNHFGISPRDERIPRH
ncbi:AraC family transcriptional regulator with amidase-like domain [Chromohalobacter marismortui]|uniref:AraC family transcriptional regulator with amidase-like domain n=1 Tax=Chromohalobacter marismortui TaxID=42055 RepID=A0A4R7NFY9_9GAMM|nr:MULTISPECIES: GlxA family transcriptional regulator [Chromohalobacter]MCI0509420.1 GlxA family transcriptional regulator [Chromohalobacter sp.]MCI0593041.1 GlxA family transcriptional regulator [Chromohalobacter sp.]TDU19292.1 AraC family transcriptional regulator with amidase-like domain [Chromohalobacter marismortui]